MKKVIITIMGLVVIGSLHAGEKLGCYTDRLMVNGIELPLTELKERVSIYYLYDDRINRAGDELMLVHPNEYMKGKMRIIYKDGKMTTIVSSGHNVVEMQSLCINL